VTCYSHDPDFFIAVLGEMGGGHKEILTFSDGNNQETAARPDT